MATCISGKSSRALRSDSSRAIPDDGNYDATAINAVIQSARNSRNVRLESLVFDLDPRFSTSGEVVEVIPEEREVRVEIRVASGSAAGDQYAGTLL